MAVVAAPVNVAIPDIIAPGTFPSKADAPVPTSPPATPPIPVIVPVMLLDVCAIGQLTPILKLIVWPIVPAAV